MARAGGRALGPTFIPTDLLGVGIFSQYDTITAVEGIGGMEGVGETS